MRKVGLLVVIAAIALAFAAPAFADCGCGKCAKPCQPCVTCGKPCNVLQSTADNINAMQAPCMQKCTVVNPVCRVAETICPGAGKERNMLKPWYSCQPCKPCAKPCNTCSSCAKPSCGCSK